MSSARSEKPTADVTPIRPLPRRVGSAGGAVGQTVPELLDEILRTACEQLECGYAAVTLLGKDGQLEHFTTLGTDQDAAERIGRPPSHLGLLGVVASGGTSVRIADIALDARSVGLPENHPPIRTLLGVPLELRGRSAGGLYLSAPIGRPEFSESDGLRAAALARDAMAGIEIARTATENARRERWYTGAADLAKELVFGGHADPLSVIAQRVAEVADADLVLVIRRAGRDSDPVVVAAAGDSAARWLRVGLPVAPELAAEVMSTGKPINATHIADVLPDHLRSGIDIDSVALIPLTGTTQARVVLSIGRYPGRRPFSASEMGMATMFAGQTALALELAETQVHRDHLALIEERDRIARDLHDHVIQRLFATGMAMESAGRTLDGPAAEVVRKSIDHIDETIKQIRATIYHLTVPILPSDSTLRARAAGLFDDLEPVLGFRPQFTVDGPADFGMSDDIVEDGLAVLREALTNVARHAHATAVEVAVVVTETTASVTVQDNGQGIGDTSRRSGLANLRARAEKHGGTLAVRSSATEGTRLIWSVPLGSGGSGGSGAPVLD